MIIITPNPASQLDHNPPLMIESARSSNLITAAETSKLGRLNLAANHNLAYAAKDA